MNPEELAEMRRTGRVQEGGGGQTRVADPANPDTYRNAPDGDVYVEFDVPADRLLPHSQGTIESQDLIARMPACRGEIPQILKCHQLPISGSLEKI